MASTPGSMDIMLSTNSKDLCSKHTDFNELLSKLKQKTQESWILYYSTQPFALHTYGVIGYRETVDVPKGTKRVSSYDFFHITRVTRITVWPDWVIVLWKNLLTIVAKYLVTFWAILKTSLFKKMYCGNILGKFGQLFYQHLVTLLVYPEGKGYGSLNYSNLEMPGRLEK